MTRGVKLTERDLEAVEAFRNFLSYGYAPSSSRRNDLARRNWPPAVWAYALGLSTWCPPPGEW